AAIQFGECFKQCRIVESIAAAKRVERMIFSLRFENVEIESQLQSASAPGNAIAALLIAASTIAVVTPSVVPQDFPHRFEPWNPSQQLFEHLWNALQHAFFFFGERFSFVDFFLCPGRQSHIADLRKHGGYLNGPSLRDLEVVHQLDDHLFYSRSPAEG